MKIRSIVLLAIILIGLFVGIVSANLVLLNAQVHYCSGGILDFTPQVSIDHHSVYVPEYYCLDPCDYVEITYLQNEKVRVLQGYCDCTFNLTSKKVTC